MDDNRPETGEMTAAITYGIGQRVAFWLRKEWPRDTVKQAARELDVSTDTVKGWLQGKPPQNRHFHQMVVRWQQTFLAFVYQPHFDWTEQARLDVELETALASLEEIRDRLRSRTNDPKSVGEIRAVENGAAAEPRPRVAPAHRKTDRAAS
jgi:hypothetical protein